MRELTKTEEILLVTIWRLKDQAYGVKIRQEVSRVLDKEFTYGNLYSALHQLAAKKYVVSTLGDTIPARRGRRRILYSISPGGFEALVQARRMNDKLWLGLSRLALDKEKGG
jgi:PadR family transcriptional regulator